MKMIKVVKADEYSHCSSCGKANKYFYINAYTPDIAKIYKVKLSIDNSNQIQTFGLCEGCLKQLREEIKRIIKMKNRRDNKCLQ